MKVFDTLCGLLSLLGPSMCSPAKKSPQMPTVVLVPGAWHLASAMDSFASSLQRIGYPTCQIGLVTVNNAQNTISDDVTALQTRALTPLIVNAGKDVVLYIHSYAGFPGSAALANLSKASRKANGQSGGIVGIIYQSAFIPHEGNTLRQMIGGNYTTWQSPKPDGLIDVIDPQSVFYNDVSKQSANYAVKAYVRRQSTLSFNTNESTTYYQSPDYDNRRAYFRTALDQALPPAGQDFFVQNSGVNWNVINLNTSHSPWYSQPAQLSVQVQTLIKGFYSTY